MASGADTQTDRYAYIRTIVTYVHAHILMHEQKQFQETRRAPACGQRAPGLKM